MAFFDAKYSLRKHFKKCKKNQNALERWAVIRYNNILLRMKKGVFLWLKEQELQNLKNGLKKVLNGSIIYEGQELLIPIKK